MDIQREFGLRLRELRTRSDLTQEQLATRCGQGFVMQRIGEIERGESNCTLQTIDALAGGLKCEPAELFLFRTGTLGNSVGLTNARLRDLWKAADPERQKKIIRVLEELLL